MIPGKGCQSDWFSWGMEVGSQLIHCNLPCPFFSVPTLLLSSKRGTRVLEQLPLKLIDHGVPEGWNLLPAHAFENRDYTVWTRGDISPILDSNQGGR